MIKRLFHIFLAAMFPIYVFLELMRIAIFTDEGFGKKWLPDADEMTDILSGKK